jgi:hypothetical protein
MSGIAVYKLVKFYWDGGSNILPDKSSAQMLWNREYIKKKE